MHRPAPPLPTALGPDCYTAPTFDHVSPMAKPNYSFEKRQRELAKKKKQDEKAEKKRAEREAAKPDTPPQE